MNIENKNIIVIDGKQLHVADILFDFIIHQKPSSNVDYFGIDYTNGRLFVQFKGGTGSYMYHGVPVDLMHAAKQADSIGKLISSQVVGKFESDKFPDRLIKVLELPLENLEDISENKSYQNNDGEPTF